MRATLKMILAAALLACPLGAAEEATTPGAEPQARDGYQLVQAFGLQVWFDPETGQMRTPSPAEAAELSAALQQLFASPATPPEPVHHEDGTVSMQLDFGLMDFSLARVRPDGSIGFDCVGGLELATELATETFQTAEPEEE